MRTKITNAIVVKDFDSEPFLGEIVIDENIIQYVGKMTDSSADKVIDAKQNIVMPGFIDAHTHSAMEIFKGNSGGMVLQDWLCEMQRKEKSLTAKDVYFATMFACLEYAKNGITTVNDNYYFFDSIAKAFADCGIRAVVSVGPRYNMNKVISDKQLEEMYQKVTAISPIVTANFYCHSIYGASEKMFDICNRLAKKYDTFVSTHVSETLEEVGKCASQNDDMSPIELLEDYGFFDQSSLAIHATNTNENDICIMAKYGASVCANFGSNFKLASGIVPIAQMKSHGINVCLGTDGSASNNRLDMFREMFLASTSQNMLLSKANVFSSAEVLKMATINGAKALKLENVGTLNKGFVADLIMLNNKGVDGAIANNLFDDLVYSYGTEDILMTMCNGKIVYDKGKYNFKKTEKLIVEKTKEIAKKF